MGNLRVDSAPSIRQEALPEDSSENPEFGDKEQQLALRTFDSSVLSRDFQPNAQKFPWPVILMQSPSAPVKAPEVTLHNHVTVNSGDSWGRKLTYLAVGAVGGTLALKYGLPRLTSYVMTYVKSYFIPQIPSMKDIKTKITGAFSSFIPKINIVLPFHREPGVNPAPQTGVTVPPSSDTATSTLQHQGDSAHNSEASQGLPTYTFSSYQAANETDPSIVTTDVLLTNPFASSR
ncbi:MAG: hypothetical protein JXA94_02000 [Parachlamydiales bacterium]|nr:hypothetical protein [Parachlamydiales bacterium]